MKTLSLILILVLTFKKGYSQQSFNMNLISNWNNINLPSLSSGQKFNDVWGWYDSSKNREYAILGSIDSIYFIDITDPSNPTIADVEAGKAQKVIWRDIDTYKNYCYAVCDGDEGSLQIFDMKYLPDSVYKVYDSDTLLSSSHTIFRNGEYLYCNSVTTNIGSLRAAQVLSLKNPEIPSLEGIINPRNFGSAPIFNSCHDSYVRNDTFYCSAENSGLLIFDWRIKERPVIVGGITNYSDKGYNHSSWITDDGKHLVFTDENLGLGVKLFDISDFDNIEEKSIFYSNKGSIAHNPYIKKDRLYLSYYEDGLVVYDIKNPKYPIKIAFYDTYLDNSHGVYNGYYGAWAVYPFLPSGNILISDMTYGLFVVGFNSLLSSDEINLTFLNVFPVPANSNEFINIEFSLRDEELLDLSLCDIKGVELKTQKIKGESGQNIAKIDLDDFPSGVYLLKVKGQKSSFCKKFVVQ